LKIKNENIKAKPKKHYVKENPSRSFKQKKCRSTKESKCPNNIILVINFYFGKMP
jgi:hypothetical protein